MRDRNPFRRRPRTAATVTADDDWKPLYQGIFRTLAESVPWNDELAEVALTVADSSWLAPIERRIIEAAYRQGDCCQRREQGYDPEYWLLVHPARENGHS
jgi:hypothetical protein